MLRTYLISATGITILLVAWINIQLLYRRLFPKSPIAEAEVENGPGCTSFCPKGQCTGPCSEHKTCGDKP